MKIIALTGAGISKVAGIPTFEQKPELRDVLTVEFRNKYPKRYNIEILKMKALTKETKPTLAHYLLTINNIDVITMNIDELHTKAGSKTLELHGHLPSDEELLYTEPCLMYNRPLLYGDVSLNYNKAISMIDSLGKDDYFLVIGASDYSAISVQLRETAYLNNVNIIEMNTNANKELISFLKEKGLKYEL